MTYEEKGKWIYLIAMIVGFVTYVAIILNRAQNTVITEVPYVSTLLWTIGITIAATIVAQIFIAIAKPGEADKNDERDKNINRYGDNISGIVLGFLMIVPFVFALAEFDHFWIANAIYAALFISGVISTIVKLVIYRRGL